MPCAHTVPPIAGACPDPAAPPRLVLNERVYAVAVEASRRGIDLPGLADTPHWSRYVSPLAVHRMGPALAAQGNDLARGLLVFAQAKPARVEDGSAGWIAAHLAGCFGCEHLDDGARVRWAESRTDLWRRIARDPLGNLEWAEAPRPWSALAAAIEFNAVEYHAEPEFRSRLPVTLTGPQLTAKGPPVLELSATAVLCLGSAATTYGVEVADFGDGLLATHAADVWMLVQTYADVLGMIGRHAQAASSFSRTAPSFSPAKPTLM